MKKKPNGYWNNYENCKEAALECENKSMFYNKYISAYDYAKKNGWLDDICSHMKKYVKLKTILTKEQCHEIALKYDNRNEFMRKRSSVFRQAKREGFYEEIVSHMKVLRRSKEYWDDFEKCKEMALKCNSKSEFIAKYPAVYEASKRNNWYEEICSHMNYIKNDTLRCIYAYEFPDNHVYIGLTNNLKCRSYRHKKRGSVFEYIKESKLEPKIIQLTDFLEIEIAKEKENEYVEIYQNNGWIILNLVKTGSIGSNIVKWSKEECAKEALKYTNRTDFQNNSRGAYLRSHRSKWLDEVCSHMILKKSPNHYWDDKDKCRIESLKYRNRSEFQKNNWAAFNYSKINKWIDEFYPKS